MYVYGIGLVLCVVISIILYIIPIHNFVFGIGTALMAFIFGVTDVLQGLLKKYGVLQKSKDLEPKAQPKKRKKISIHGLMNVFQRVPDRRFKVKLGN